MRTRRVTFARMTLSMLGIKPVWLRTREELGFQPSVEECEKLITPATRAIVLVTPNNPVRRSDNNAVRSLLKVT